MNSSKLPIVSHVYSNPLVDRTNFANYNLTSNNGIVLPVDLLSHQEENQLLQEIIAKCDENRFPVSFIKAAATLESFRSCYKMSKILHFSGILTCVHQFLAAEVLCPYIF